MSNQTRGGRINRINPLIQKIISSALLRNSDPVLNKATITHVSTSPDLKKSWYLFQHSMVMKGL